MPTKIQLKANLLIHKYETCVSNLEWHLKNNMPNVCEKELFEKRIDAYKEIIKDLKSL